MNRNRLIPFLALFIVSGISCKTDHIYIDKNFRYMNAGSPVIYITTVINETKNKSLDNVHDLLSIAARDKYHFSNFIDSGSTMNEMRDGNSYDMYLHEYFE